MKHLDALGLPLAICQSDDRRTGDMWYQVKFEARRRHASATRTYNVVADHEAGAILRAASLYESPFAGEDDDEAYVGDEAHALLVTVTQSERPPVTP